MSDKLADIRKEYTRQVLEKEHAAKDPMQQFRKWFDEAVNSNLPDANAMNLATASVSGRPSSRIVLLKGLTSQGFLFFTNYNSRKGRELEQNPYAALNFFWPELERQVRIEGPVEKVSGQISDQYFNSRPLGSRIGAWASPQSQVIADRFVLKDQAESVEKQYGEDIPRPPHWGGYCLTPDAIEFWQGRASRLHDRLRYSRQTNNEWLLERLAP